MSRIEHGHLSDAERQHRRRILAGLLTQTPFCLDLADEVNRRLHPELYPPRADPDPDFDRRIRPSLVRVAAEAWYAAIRTGLASAAEPSRLTPADLARAADHQALDLVYQLFDLVPGWTVARLADRVQFTTATDDHAFDLVVVPVEEEDDDEDDHDTIVS